MRNAFRERAVVGRTKQIDDPLKAEMKRNRGNIDIYFFGNTFRRHDHFIGRRDGVPLVSRLIITDFDAISSARLRDERVITSEHRLDQRLRFFAAVRLYNTQINLSIDRLGFCEHAGPIDIPISEKRAGIARDGKEDWLTVDAWKLRELDEIGFACLVFAQKGDRPAGKTKTLIKGWLLAGGRWIDN